MAETFKFILMICFIPLVSFLGGTIYSGAFPELSLVFDASPTLIKFSLTIYFLGMIFGTILSGLLSDLYGRLYILVFFLILFCLSSLFCGFSVSIVWFLVGRFFQGMGSAAGPIIIISLVADQFDGPHYKKLVSYVLIMVGIGPGLAPIIGSFILHFFDWRSIFYFLTILGILALGLVFSVGIKKRVSHQGLQEALQEYISFIKHPFFRYYCLIISVLYGAFNAILVICPYIFRLHYGWSIVEFAWVGLALAIGDSLGAFLNDQFHEKAGSKRIVLAGLAISAVALVLLILVELPSDGLWFLGITTLFVIGGNLTAASLTTNAIKLNSHFTGIASSLVYLTKFMLCSIVLVLVLFFPASLLTINLFIFSALLISLFGYLKIRTVL
jgi:DHA1 family bicyclomycin/chloramphenicol resistance-like MFS transporter